MIRLQAKIPGIQPGMTTMARSGHRPNTRLFFLASSPCKLYGARAPLRTTFAISTPLKTGRASWNWSYRVRSPWVMRQWTREVRIWS